MKIIRPYGLFRSISFYGIIIMNIIIATLKLPSILATILTFIVGNAMMFNAAINDHYMFEYDSEKLVVKNTWNPFFYQGYWLKSLKKIEFDYFNRAGKGIRIYFEDKKEVYICACDEVDLKGMVEDINNQIKINSQSK